jgi:hypothetical protein
MLNLSVAAGNGIIDSDTDTDMVTDFVFDAGETMEAAEAAALPAAIANS